MLASCWHFRTEITNMLTQHHRQHQKNLKITKYFDIEVKWGEACRAAAALDLSNWKCCDDEAEKYFHAQKHKNK